MAIEKTTILSEFMKQNALTQEQLAKAADVSQSTISHALKGNYDKQGAARKKLYDYVERHWPETQKKQTLQSLYGFSDSSNAIANSVILNAFQQIWDGTDDHADAIAEVIKSLGALNIQTTREFQ
jgi:predicted transcriptional regulator